MKFGTPSNFAPAMLKVRFPDTALKSASPVKVGPIELDNPLEGCEAEISAPWPEPGLVEEHVSWERSAARNEASPVKVALSNQASPEKVALSNQASPEKVALPNQASPEKVALSNQASPEKVALSNQASPVKVALSNQALPVKVALPNGVAGEGGAVERGVAREGGAVERGVAREGGAVERGVARKYEAIEARGAQINGNWFDSAFCFRRSFHWCSFGVCLFSSSTVPLRKRQNLKSAVARDFQSVSSSLSDWLWGVASP